MKYLKKYESPDQIKYQGDGYNKTLHWMNDDAIAFGYTNGIIEKFIVCSPSKSHGDCGFDRQSMNYSGRLWLGEQVISFWEYPDPKTFENIINSLESHLDISMQPDEFWGEFTLPTVARNDPKYDPETMWRGPVWANVNYFFIEALKQIEEEELANELREKTLQMIMKHPSIYEFYSAETGDPPAKAANIFGWTAAVFIDLALQVSSENENHEIEREITHV